MLCRLGIARVFPQPLAARIAERLGREQRLHVGPAVLLTVLIIRAQFGRGSAGHTPSFERHRQLLAQCDRLGVPVTAQGIKPRLKRRIGTGSLDGSQRLISRRCDHTLNKFLAIDFYRGKCQHQLIARQ